jgi:hypothetical protein
MFFLGPSKNIPVRFGPTSSDPSLCSHQIEPRLDRRIGGSLYRGISTRRAIGGSRSPMNTPTGVIATCDDPLEVIRSHK